MKCSDRGKRALEIVPVKAEELKERACVFPAPKIPQTHVTFVSVALLSLT